jgi:hypothetical protein
MFCSGRAFCMLTATWLVACLGLQWRLLVVMIVLLMTSVKAFINLNVITYWQCYVLHTVTQTITVGTSRLKDSCWRTGAEGQVLKASFGLQHSLLTYAADRTLPVLSPTYCGTWRTAVDVLQPGSLLLQRASDAAQIGQHVPPKRLYPATRLQGVTIQKVMHWLLLHH